MHLFFHDHNSFGWVLKTLPQETFENLAGRFLHAISTTYQNTKSTLIS